MEPACSSVFMCGWLRVQEEALYGYAMMWYSRIRGITLVFWDDIHFDLCMRLAGNSAMRSY